MATTAKYGGRATAAPRGKPETASKRIEGTKEVDLDPGDEKARVKAARGFKHWLSAKDFDKDAMFGGTVEASVEVEIACGQSPKEIRIAAKAAGAMAEELADIAMAEMDEHLFEYMDKQK